MNNALRFAGRTRRVEDVEQVLGVHGLGRALGTRRSNEVAVEVVATRHHGDFDSPGELLPALHDDDAFERRARLKGLVRVQLQRHHSTSPVPPVGGDEHFRLSVVDTIGQGLGAEATEDH